MDYSSIRSMADALARGLEDQREPTVCPDCLSGFAGIFHCKNHDRTVHTPRLRIDCHALFDACVATLTFPRTLEELERLALKLAANRRLCSTHRMSLRPFKSEEYLNSLMWSVAEIFAVAVRLGRGAFEERAVKAKSSFADKQGRWPARVEQLFPNGVKATVEALLGYGELYISKGPLGMITILILVVRPVIMPVLAVDPFRARLVQIVLKMLDPVASGLTSRAPWMDDHKESHALACHVTHILGVVKNGAGARPHDCARFFVGHESVLLRLLGRIIDHMEDDDPMLESYAYSCIELADCCDDPLPARVDQWLDAHGRCRCKKATGKTVHKLVVMYKATRVCAGPSCTLSIFQKEDGKPFPACARCRVPRYCSRACQLADWKGAPLPHKDLCAVFCKLNAHTCISTSDDLSQFEAAYLRAEPDFSERDKQALAAFVSSDRQHSHAAACD